MSTLLRVLGWLQLVMAVRTLWEVYRLVLVGSEVPLGDLASWAALGIGAVAGWATMLALATLLDNVEALGRRGAGPTATEV